MKQNEIASRQNRVVYILLIVTGALGLAWAIWKHWYNTKEAPARHVSVRAAPRPSTWLVRPLAPTQAVAKA